MDPRSPSLLHWPRQWVGACSKRGGLGGGWRWFCTRTSSALDCFAKTKHCAREKCRPPSHPSSASQSAKKSTLRTGHGHSEGRGVKRCGGGCPDRFR